MTQSEAIALEQCPLCSARVMKNHVTGLVACLARLDFKDCFWSIRVLPWEGGSGRKELSKKEQRLQALEEEVRRRIEESKID